MIKIKYRILNIYHDYFYSGKDETIRNTRLFAIEGMLLTAIIHLAIGNFSFYATRLNATDFQLSLVSSLPSLVGMLFLIPGGILINKFKSKKSFIKVLTLLYGFFYFLISFAPFFGEYAVIYFLSLLPLASIPYHIYNASWQSYFYDLIPSEKRNYTFTLRTMCTFIVSSSLPLITGQILARSAADKKLIVHQAFLMLCFVAAIIQRFVLSKTVGENPTAAAKTSFNLSSVKEVFKNKEFILFLIPMILFHMSWHMDWSVNFISQTRYYGANEAWLSYVVVGGNVMQFLFVKVWSHIARRQGVRYTLFFGALGYSMYAVLSVINLLVPSNVALWFNLLAYITTNIYWIAFTLSGLQALLEVIPKKNSTLTISIYNMLVLLSNCVMPVIGVRLYTHLGGDKQAMIGTFIIISLFRLTATFLLFLRWRNRKHV